MDNSAVEKRHEFITDRKLQLLKLRGGVLMLVTSAIVVILGNQILANFSYISGISAAGIAILGILEVSNALFAWTTKVSLSETQVAYDSFMYHWVASWERVKLLEMVNTLDPDRMKREYATLKLWGDKKTLLGQIDLMAFPDFVAEKIASQLRNKAISIDIPTERS